MKALYFFSFLLAASCAAAPVELKNDSIRVLILPEQGGKIAMLEGNGAAFVFSPEELRRDAIGFGKNRIWGDQFEYAAAKWKMESHTAQSLTLSMQGSPPRLNLGIEKTFSIPKQGGYIKIVSRYKNVNPIAGSFGIAPWMHNAFPLPKSPARKDYFLMAHAQGVERIQVSNQTNQSAAFGKPGNWMGYFNPDGGNGLLLVSETAPAAAYGCITPSIGTLEFLYPNESPVPETVTTCYLVPLSSMEPAKLAEIKLPVRLSPDLTAPASPGERVRLETMFSGSGKEPFEMRLSKYALQISPDVPIAVTLDVRKTGKEKFATFCEVEMPEGVELVAHTGNYWWFEQEVFNLLDKTQIRRGDQPYLRYRFEIAARSNPGFRPHGRLLLRAKNPDVKGVFAFRSYADKKLTSSGEVPLTTIRIPAAAVPKRFNALLDVDYALIDINPEFEQQMKHLGVNGICMNYNVPNRVIDPGQVRAMIARLKRHGFFTAVMGAYFFAPPRNRPDLRTLDINGKTAHEFNFMKRGNWLDEVAQYTFDKGLAFDYDLLISDYEGYFRGERLGFTPDAENAFKAYLEKQRPDLPWIKPAVAAGSPHRYPEHYRLWTRFKADRFADYAEEVVSRSRKRAPQSGTAIGWCICPHPSEETMLLDNLMDNRRFNRFLNYSMPMTYNNVYRSMPRYRKEIELFQQMAKGSPVRLMPTLTLGFREAANTFPPEHSFFLLLETALLQCDGAYLWPGVGGSDGNALLFMAKALDLIARNEDMIYGGKRMDPLVEVEQAENAELKLPVAVEPLVLVHKNKALVYLAEYGTDPVTLRVRFRIASPCRVRVLHGRCSERVVKPGEIYEIKLPAGSEKALLLELSTEDGQAFQDVAPRLKNSPAEQDARNRIVQESFDHGTRGKNRYSHALFGFDDDGVRGKCLDFKNYQSAWVLPEKFDIPSGEATVDFWFRGRNAYLPGGKHLWVLCRILLPPGKDYMELMLRPKDGRMCLFVTRNKQEHWLFSKTDRWPGGIWQHVRVNLGKSGCRLIINGKVEAESSRPVSIGALENIQLGREWVSFGQMDELSVYSERK